ncbi:hypothetical protein C8Q80DRAFT_264021 [Daedaleopsis nitida]|nr:hypothetical protein C8Q80DRAFT_264021 [Daedaleopsis nitida]
MRQLWRLRCFISSSAVRQVALTLTCALTRQSPRLYNSRIMSGRYVVDPEFLGLVFQLIVFGGFLVLYSITVWLLLFSESSRRQRLDRLNIVMYAISTSLITLSLANTVIAVHSASYQYDNLDYDLQMSDSLLRAYVYTQQGIYITTIIIGDSFLTYRLFVVWDRNWRITVLPILCIVLGTAASTVFELVLFILPAITNLMMTCLIAGRIAWTRKRSWRDLGQATSVHRRSYWSLVETFLETAGATTIMLLAVACTIFADGNAFIDPLPGRPAFHWGLFHAGDTARSYAEAATRRRGSDNRHGARPWTESSPVGHAVPADHSSRLGVFRYLYDRALD